MAPESSIIRTSMKTSLLDLNQKFKISIWADRLRIGEYKHIPLEFKFRVLRQQYRVLHELGGRLALSFINWVDNPVSATQMADLISNLQLRVLTGASAKQLLDILISTKDPETQVHDLIATHDLATDSTSQEDADLVRLATEVVNEYPEKAEQVRSGKKPNLRNFFIGNLMRATGGKVDIQVCKQVIDRVFSDS